MQRLPQSTNKQQVFHEDNIFDAGDIFDAVDIFDADGEVLHNIAVCVCLHRNAKIICRYFFMADDDDDD